VRTRQGGTKKWCPSCEAVRVCAAINPASIVREAGQRWYRTDHVDIQWFRRGLVCQTCGEEWLTAELPEKLVEELAELREALTNIKENAEAYAAESKKASESLEKLSASLSVLRALESYKSS
jgi:hypothetical protein